MFGNEAYHIEVRVRIALELALNNCYLNDSLADGLSATHLSTITSITRNYALCPRTFALGSKFSGNDIPSIYEREALSTTLGPTSWIYGCLACTHTRVWHVINFSKKGKPMFLRQGVYTGLVSTCIYVQSTKYFISLWPGSFGELCKVHFDSANWNGQILWTFKCIEGWNEKSQKLLFCLNMYIDNE